MLANISFFSPNITIGQFKKTISEISKITEDSMETQMFLGNPKNIDILTNDKYNDFIMDYDGTKIGSLIDNNIIKNNQKYRYRYRVGVYLMETESNSQPLIFYTYNKPPNFGQGEKIVNTLDVCFSYPGEV